MISNAPQLLHDQPYRKVKMYQQQSARWWNDIAIDRTGAGKTRRRPLTSTTNLVTAKMASGGRRISAMHAR